jgi:hypothetical protein
MMLMKTIRVLITTTPRRLVVGLFIFAAACHRQAPAPAPAPARPAPQRAPVPAAGIRSGATLLQAMHDRYPAWYRTLTFMQHTTLATPSGGEIVQTWYDAAELPGRLRIDTDIAARAGTLYARDSIYAFNNGRLVRADTGLNELLVLGFDVYTQPVARSEAQLRGLGYDLSRFHETTWHGVPMYVVGALRGDTTSKQFWIDRDKLLFQRLIERGRQGMVEIRFDHYLPVAGGWVAADVVQLVNGTRRLHEEYADIRANPPLSEALFDAASWATTPSWAKAPAKH